jgi:uncharacterized protein
VRRLLAVVALLCASFVPASALDFPRLDGRVVDEARLLDAAAKRTLENRLANLEAHTGKQLMVVTLASARGMTVDDYGLELRKHWNLEPNGRRATLIVSPSSGRSVIQFDRALGTVLTNAVTQRILDQTMAPRFNAGDFPGGTLRAAAEIIDLLEQGSPGPLRIAERGTIAENGSITVPATAEFPALSSRVVDDADVLDAGTRAALRAKLAAHEAGTSNQIVVATVKSLHGNSIEDYANRLFRHWRLGQRGKNNGVLLLHAPAERKIRIEVGYGLEGTLTDAIAKTIIQNSITPRFKANDFAGGMTRGVDDIIKVLSGGAEEFKQNTEPPQSFWAPQELFLMVVMVLIVIANLMGGILAGIHALLVKAGLARKKPKSGFWHWVNSPSSSGGSSGSWLSSDSSWSSSSSSDSFSGGGGDSGGGGSSGDY